MTGRVTAKKAKPKVCLVMIVRDEAEILRERLEAVVGVIDSWLIVDTGSTDRTQEIVLDTLRNLPGRLVERPWWGFADARTFAVSEAARDFPGAWALLLDADTVFHALPKWRELLKPVDADAISCQVHHGAIRYSHPRLLRLGEHFAWRWRGVLHEYLEIPAGRKVVETDLIWVEHGSGGARSKDPEKFRRDAELLRSTREAMALHPAGDDADLLPRYTFYEAQSWRDAGRPLLAELAYEARACMGGFFEEIYLSWLNIGTLREAAGETAGAVEAWLAAWAVDPRRAEALIGLATIHRARSLWAPAYAFAWQGYLAASVGPVGMFADQNVGWRADFELGVAGWYTGHEFEGRRACERVLESGLAPEDVKATTRANLALYP